MRLAEASRRIELTAATDHATGVFGTSYSACALPCFDIAATLGDEGVPIGPVLSSGGLFSYDPFVIYNKRDRFNVGDPNMVVMGKLGSGKSTTVQVYLRRQWCFGRFIRIIDPRGEYRALAEDLGGQVVRLSREDGVTLNPLESPETRHALLRSVASATMRRDLLQREPALLNAALDAAGKNPVLPDVLELLFHPTPDMAAKVRTTERRFAAEARDLAMAMQPLCEGDLRGLFDGPTSADVDFSNQLILLDLEPLWEDQTIGILMACAMGFLQAQIDRHYKQGALVGQPPKSIMVIDEAWKILSLRGVGEWLRERVKFSRKFALQNVEIFHALGDLDAVGNEGERVTRLVQRLVRDCSTFVLFAMGEDDARHTQQLLGLSDVERDLLISGLDRGCALWRIGPHRFVVFTDARPSDLAVTSTDRAMTG